MNVLGIILQPAPERGPNKYNNGGCVLSEKVRNYAFFSKKRSTVLLSLICELPDEGARMRLFMSIENLVNG